ncbi:adenylosuccinate synthetase [Actinoplanes sp. NPDC051494]|uniref:adenylosuccinate synthetase n=1 Tax=Actinoplanes sp. NPDC051494 TaxID=3363907 RepID=UPI00379BE890
MTSEHVAVVDLGYGDAGKGTVVDALCGDGGVRAVLRFNGGAQAAHNVVAPDGRHHTFAQFGSGTFAGVPTHLTRFVVVDPLALAAEAASLGNPFHLLTIDADALLVTPWHRAANQVRERRRGGGRHGSCGMGIGQTMEYALSNADAPRAADVRSAALRLKLAAVRDRLVAAFGPLDAPPLDDVVAAFRAFGAAVSIVDASYTAKLLREGRCVFEGAQGVLLDEWRGWHPYTTWSTTTFDNVAELCDSFERLGVVRTYTTRHGAGPFVTEAPLDLPEAHNGVGQWQGAFRVGHFDAVAHRYAVEVAGGVDALAVTHLDAPSRCPALRICTSYDVADRLEPGPFRDLAYQRELTALVSRAEPAALHRPASFVDDIADLLGAPVRLESWGPNRTGKRFRTAVRVPAPAR